MNANQPEGITRRGFLKGMAGVGAGLVLTGTGIFLEENTLSHEQIRSIQQSGLYLEDIARTWDIKGDYEKTYIQAFGEEYIKYGRRGSAIIKPTDTPMSLQALKNGVELNDPIFSAMPHISLEDDREGDKYTAQRVELLENLIRTITPVYPGRTSEVRISRKPDKKQNAWYDSSVSTDMGAPLQYALDKDRHLYSSMVQLIHELVHTTNPYDLPLRHDAAGKVIAKTSFNSALPYHEKWLRAILDHSNVLHRYFNGRMIGDIVESGTVRRIATEIPAVLTTSFIFGQSEDSGYLAEPLPSDFFDNYPDLESMVKEQVGIMLTGKTNNPISQESLRKVRQSIGSSYLTFLYSLDGVRDELPHGTVEQILQHQGSPLHGSIELAAIKEIKTFLKENPHMYDPNNLEDLT